MDCTVTEVTPDLARAMLAANTRNRLISAALVTAYARDMVAGRWPLNGEAVKIAWTGDVLDGQHRLLAVIEADTAVDMLVISGLDPDTQKTMDSGRKRTLADNLRIAGVGNTAVVAAISMRGWMWDNGDKRLTKTVRPTQGEQREWIANNPVVHRSAELAARVRTSFKPVTQSISGTAHVLFSRIDTDDTAEFFARLSTGAGLEDGDPILRLRDRFMRDAMDNRVQPDVVRLGLFIKAWNAFRKDETIGGLLMTPETKVPDPI